MPVITVTGLKKNFKEKEVIKGLDFNLENGKCTALIGPNGSGKSTTLRMLSGLIKPSSGKIQFQNESNFRDIRKYIGYLPQFPVFHEWMTGLEFLQYVGQLGGLSKGISKQRSEELLILVGLADAKKMRIGKYSGGMKQRLGIAQAIIHDPKLVMLDEPVSALDPFGRREVLELLGRLKEDKTILFSTHILNDAEEVCDNILFLHNGIIVESGSMSELRSRHHQQKIVMEFGEGTKEFVASLTSEYNNESCTIEGNQVTFIVKDIEQAKTVFLRKIADKNMPLIRFEVGRLTLEDVFLKVVQK